MRILLVEDELDLANAIAKGLLKNNIFKYKVDCVYDGQDAIDKYFENRYDLIILDLNLPKVDGLDVLETIRNDSQDIPILILSARINIDDKVVGLDLGANDYLAKPFDFKELEARVNALLRYQDVIKKPIIKVNKVSLDTKHNLLYDENNNIIKLTKSEHEILSFLIRNKGIMFTDEAIIDNLWTKETNSTSLVRVHIKNIREKLHNPDIIKTKRGCGYYVEEVE
ncbi:MAG: response regulator transcription factor [Bacilli bacterium]|jgi:DNA-binding response OmpR family regulator|nr:response regulator transcription factor [Bacilli bacterium]